ncbi:MAG: undecaprenyl/decaprenyl-phosphate alpha-N-acetylglucosaminyl 1-phosphate transferase [Chitinivibrionia bacterium]|nr:undecaprenyl/decaprenyl-phosphate alpha-N-acetylglucosaminyl 1-phosphate transferase [Chitinivibrionia bacterium]
MAWLEFLFLFIISFVIVFITVPQVRKYAHQWKLGNKPNGRRVHASAIPHLGGIGITCGILASLAAYEFLVEDSVFLFARVVPGISLIIILGLLDDILSLKALQKLTVQILAAFVLVFSGFKLVAGVPAIDGVAVYATLASTIFMVGVSNSMNLIDGHDGLAAGLCFISSAAFAVVAALAEAPDALLLSLATGGACLAFLIYNFPPAKIFMGDTGSMLLGICLALISCSLTAAKPSLYTFFAVFFILGIPMLDTMLAIARRLILRVPLFGADCMHIHHTLVSFGVSERQTLVLLYGMQAVFSFVGIFAVQGHLFSVILGTAILLVLFVVFLRWMTVSTRTEKEAPAKLAHDAFPSLDEIAK